MGRNEMRSAESNLRKTAESLFGGLQWRTPKLCHSGMLLNHAQEKVACGHTSKTIAVR